jgi:hypothetical protein
VRAARLVSALTAALVVAATAGGCAVGRAAAADPTATEPAPEPARQVAHPTWDVLTPQTLVPALASTMVDAGSLTWTTHTSDWMGPIENVVDVDMTTSNSRIRLTLPEGQTEIRSVDGHRFVQAPATRGKFYDVTLEDPGLVRITAGVDPVRPVRALFGAVVAVRPAGPRVDVDGVTTQPYDVVVATARLTDGLGDLAGGVPRDQLPSTVTLTYWVDQGNRLRRATANVAGTPVEMTFTNWGTDFGIAAPTKEELTVKLKGS